MAEMTLYGLKSCDTCRKALKALAAAGRAVDFVDVRAEADLPAHVPVWLDVLGAHTLINTRSTTWRGLDAAERARADTDPVGLLTDHPALIKRPVIAASGSHYCGWTPQTRSALGLA